MYNTREAQSNLVFIFSAQKKITYNSLFKSQVENYSEISFLSNKNAAT